ncbi:MAG: hypothetical protein ABSC20_02340 [Candidatus Bathyarchaeia archaeon]|jgi:hypothetical protein
MKKRLAIFLALAIIVVIVVSAFAAMEIYGSFSAPVASKKPFYVGVTYCGDNVTEAEQLIDRVKTYTNLFVVQSGPLMDNGTALEQICDYAVNSGLNIIVYMANGVTTINVPSFLDSAQASWGSHFLGMYYDDEPGGKMLDSTVNLYINNERVTKQQMGAPLTVNYDNSTGFVLFWPSGQITTSIGSTTNETVNGISNVTVTKNASINYYPNGTITSSPDQTSNYPNGTSVYVYEDQITYQPNGEVINGTEVVMTGYPNGTYVTNRNQPISNPGNISQFEPYQELWDSRPLQTYNEAANAFVSTEQQTLSSIGNQSDINLFTSDYGLYWFDYLGGYNTVFAELFGTQTDAQTLALVRGAADMQDKSWGAMIEWANRASISLQTGDQMYSEMKQSYESDAEYVIVFNYSPSDNGTGLLQDEQFGAIQRFWTDVVQNPKDTNNVTAQDALVLPNDYGWGMRNQNDTIWGLWQPDNSSQQVWNALQASLSKYGSKLDIIYDDPAYPTAGRYQHVIYWNQTI